MAQKPGISAEATLQWLQAAFHADVTQLTVLSGGDWSQAYAFVSQQQKYVLRWCHSSETFEKDTFAGRWRSESLPVPRVLASGFQYDTHFAITEFAAGQFFNRLNADELTRLLPALFKLLDALRTADLTDTRGYGGWDKDGVGQHPGWHDYLLGVRGSDTPGRFTSGWYAKLAKSPVGTAIFDELYARFEKLVEKCPEVREVIHADLLNDNLVVADAAISGVLDWQCSLYGDALYEVAWFLFYEPWFPVFGKVQLGQKLLAHYSAMTANNAHLQARLLCYQLHIGLDSIIYNTAKQDWQAVQEVADYTRRLSHRIDSV